MKKELKEFIMELSKKIKVERVILFGSRADNSADKESDVDLIVVSSDFEGVNYFDRAKELYESWKIDLPVDFICYTPKEFNILKRRISIVSQAIKKGVVLN